MTVIDKLEQALADAERKAWDSLAKYKFWMFGYHAAQWVLLNRVSGLKRPNPFKQVVLLAREINRKPELKGEAA